MSDEEQSFDEGISPGGEEQPPQKTGFLPAVVLKILKFAAIGIGGIIFIVTVVVITVSILNKGQKAQTYAAVSPEYAGKPPVYDYYSNIGEIRGRTSDIAPHTVIVEPNLGYDSKNKNLQTELIGRTPQIKDMLRNYFAGKTAEELQPKYEKQIKAELKEMINGLLSSGKIDDVIFLNFNVFEF